ncbi:PPC domain-containing protein [Massilia rubra]|uniref:Peptidase C-terminal archaeal/bacterial domain-containing protein n=1 Tax=Massilia rubra TaxID=2607910 RepID=A0ABX0LNW1_9BURK|nr:PPC domain-containing protein [Massilia rubra]NHZ36293.1 hypothetical protein [Massilia rubra]
MMLLRLSPVSLTGFVLSAALSLHATSAVAGALGSEYALTSYPSTGRNMVYCNKAPNGDRLVLWSLGEDNFTLMLNRVDANRNQIGPVADMRLDADVLAVASNKVGGFVVLRKVISDSTANLYATVYNRAGNIVVPAVQVNTAPAPSQVYGDIAMAPDGSFTVAWYTWEKFPNVLYARRFSAAGESQTYQTIIASGVELRLQNLAIDAGGNQVITYASVDTGVRFDLWQSRFDYANDRYEKPSRVNVDVTRSHMGGRLSMNESGNYVVTWSAPTEDVNKHKVYAQLFYRNGARAPGPVVVSETASYDAQTGSALFANNSYAVTWAEVIGGLRYIKSRQVDGANGNFLAELVVSPGLQNVTTNALCSDPSGSYSVLWGDVRGFNTPQATGDVRVRDYAADTMPVIVPIGNNQMATNMSAQTGYWRYFKVTVPANTSGLRVALSSQSTPASGNADLYVRYAGLPTLSTFDGRTSTVGNTEALQFGAVPPGAFYVGVFAQAGYAGANLSVSYY